WDIHYVQGFYKLLARLNHGHLTHADRNAVWLIQSSEKLQSCGRALKRSLDEIQRTVSRMMSEADKIGKKEEMRHEKSDAYESVFWNLCLSLN
ncbi:unnamed protein product, partial [Brassica rapa subsp. narinosa]